MAKKLFVSVLFSLIIVFGVFAGEITVAVDSSSSYTPTQIVNGDFQTKPWMNYWKGGTRYTNGMTSSDSEITSSEYNSSGWNTTEIKTFGGNLFEWTNSGTNYYVEMNCYNSAALYQDLATNELDVIKWSLKHLARSGYGDAYQKIVVKIGKPYMTDGSPVPASGIKDNIDTKLESGKATFTTTGVTEGSDIAFYNAGDLDYLTVAKTDSSWHTASGIYVVSKGQNITRFSFEVAPGSTIPDGGNYLDDITFSTLIGNLHASKNADGSVTVTGYWGESNSSKKLIVKSGNITNEITMSDVLNKNFVITIPSDKIDSSSYVIDVYHQDYEVAKRSIHIHKWTYVSNAQQLLAYCSNTQSAEQCSYQGRENAVNVILATNRLNITAQFNPLSSNDYVSWNSNNTGIVTIDSETGLIKSVAEGATTITGSALNGSAKAKSVAVKVLPETVDSSVVKVTGITLNKTSLIISVGSSETLSATVAPTDAAVKSVTWMSSDNSIVKVNPSTGVLNALSVGNAVITAIANDGSGKTASCNVTVLIPNYLKFTANSANSSVTPAFLSGSYEYSTDGGNTWTTGDNSGSTINLAVAGDSVLLRGVECTTDSFYHFSMTGSVAASGSVTSLSDNIGGNVAIALTESCYESMFYDCASLTTAPELPALTLATGCYDCMFQECTSLTKAPKLPATIMAKECYRRMFCGCTSLTDAPALNSTSLAMGCYFGMFERCSLLFVAPKLPAATLAENCYSEMFYNSGIKEIPEFPENFVIPDTSVGYLSSMFNGCSNLNIKVNGTMPVGGGKIFTCDCDNTNPVMYQMFKNTYNTEVDTPETGKTYYWVPTTVYAINVTLNNCSLYESVTTEIPKTIIYEDDLTFDIALEKESSYSFPAKDNITITGGEITKYDTQVKRIGLSNNFDTNIIKLTIGNITGDVNLTVNCTAN